MTDILLAFEIVSKTPSFAIAKKDNECKYQLLETINLNNYKDNNDRYELARFTDIVVDALQEYNCSLKNIKHFAYCNGAGAFSAIRVAVIFARLLYRLNNDVKILQFSMNYILFLASIQNIIIKKNQIYSLYLKIGIQGYAKECYMNNSIITPNTIVPKQEINSNDEYTILFEEPYIGENILLSEILCNALINENISHEEFEAKSLEDIQPNYIRRPNVTVSKTVINGL